MILSRIAETFRRQDWFMVFVETMIVVLGVFLGPAGWTAERADRAREREDIARLPAEHHQGGSVPPRLLENVSNM